MYDHAKVIEKAIADDPTTLSILQAHYLRWVIFTIKGENYMMYQGIFDTDFDSCLRRCLYPLREDGIQSAFEALEGWPADYATNPSAIVKFFREHQCPSFLEYSEHPLRQLREKSKSAQGQGGIVGCARPDAVIANSPCSVATTV